jgi:signal transduction histidine kinase
MNYIELISLTINAIPHPVVALDKNNMVIAANQQTSAILNIKAEVTLPVSFGLCISCVNANNFGKCGSTMFCELCKMNSYIQYLFDNPTLSITRECIYCSLINNQYKDFKVSFTGSFLDVGDGFVLVTFKENHELSEDHTPHYISDNQTIENIQSEINTDLTDKDTNRETVILQLEQEAVNTLFEHCSNGILLFDVNTQLIKINHKLINITGLNLNEIQSRLIDQSFITQCQTSDGVKFESWTIAQLLSDRILKFSATVFSKFNTELIASIEIIPIIGARNTPSGYLLMVADHSIEMDLINKVEQSFNALELSPNECFFVNRSGEITYANQIARTKFDCKTASNCLPKIYDINLNTNESWWLEKCQILDKDGILQYESFHTDQLNKTYPVTVLLYFIHHKQDDLICYYASDISEKRTSEEKAFHEIKINNSLSEISRELTFSDKFESVALLVRQYALEITNSEFCFLNYYDPESNLLVSSIYSDSDKSYKEEVRIVGTYLAEFYKNIFLDSEIKRQASKKILNDTSFYLIDNKPINSFLPFDKMAWSGVFFHDDFQGMIFVAGKETDYTEADLLNLENLTNLFGLAVNRIHEKAKLIKTNNRLSLAIEVANLGMFEIFPLEDKVFISPHLNKMLGGSYQEIIVSPVDLNRMVHPDDLGNVIQAFQDHLSLQTDFFKHVVRSALPGTQYRWYQTTGRILSYSPSGLPMHIIGVQQDITEQIELTEQISRSREEAIAANNAKSAFLARVSHELRTPLNAIIGFTDLLTGNIQSPTQLEFLSNIKKSSHTLMELISNILDFSKIEAGILSLSFSSVNIFSLIKEIQQLFTPIIANKQIELRIEINPDTPEYVTIDELRVKQILINLIGNATKFTETGYIKVSVTHAAESDHTINLLFAVEDSGIGIKTSAHKTIFNDFTQQEDQDNRRFGGTGLGLGIVKQLVSLMGGEIKLVSEPNKGSCFSFNIPRCSIDKPTNNEQASKAQIPVIQNPNTTPFPNLALNQVDIELFNEQMGLDWSAFISMPSFKTIDNIIRKLELLSNNSQNQFFNHYATKLDLCKKTFNVLELDNLIKEIERIIRKT